MAEARAPRYLPYRVLAGTMAVFCLLFGLLFMAAFVDRTLFQVFARPLFATDHWGYYMVGFAGVALMAWGGCLVAAARAPKQNGGVATATTAGLILGASLRLLAWYSGDYWPERDQLRLEAGLFALLALGFVWLRPPHESAADDDTH